MSKTWWCVPVLALSACSWGIKLNDGGQRVHTAWNRDVSACRFMGKVTVSVADHVGPMSRNDIKVRDELEIMARNEAAELSADTVKPLGQPHDGEQAWGAYACGSRLGPESGREGYRRPAAVEPVQAPAADGGGFQSYPVKGG
ncbi:DUF4156 domain-containing protein [Frateuria aurantia]